MIHCSVCNIKQSAELPKPASPRDNHYEAYAQETGYQFNVLKVLQYKTRMKAMIAFQALIGGLKSEVKKDSICMLTYEKKELRLCKNVTILQYVDGAINSKLIVNPMWSGIKKTKRNLESAFLSVESSQAMQSQLFAMLNSVKGDNSWLQSFSLEDFQVDTMYQWQQDFFPKENSMSVTEMTNMMKNVLNDARLPWIRLEFKNEGNACSFSISRADGGVIVLTKGQDGDTDTKKWDWLQDMDDEKFEEVGVADKEYRLKISDMKLTMILSWAMKPYLILHELAHYITFCYPTSYRLNRGEVKLSLAQYRDLFSGHGSCYMAIFVRLIIDFMYVDEEYLYNSLNESGLHYFPIKSIRMKDVEKGITKYLENA